MNIHENQRKLLQFLKGIEDLGGYSYWDIARETGLGSAQNVIHHLKQLEKFGYLRRNMSNPSLFEVLKDPIEDVLYLNLYGFAQCGNTIEFLSENNVKEKIAISTKIFGISNPKESFFVKARGDSMTPEIFENDLIIFEKTDNVDDGFVALIIHNNEPKIKQIFKTQNGILLKSFNRSHPDVIVKNEKELDVVGVARHMIKSI